MSLNLDKLVSAQSIYDKTIRQTIETIKKDKNIEASLKKIILFCKYTFSINYAQRKKFLCLMLMRDLSQALKSQQFQKILDQSIPYKLFKAITLQINNVNANRQSRHQEDEVDYSQRMIRFGVQTISFWAKKMSFVTGKSQFAQAYEDLKKIKGVELPKTYEYYRSQKLTLGLLGDRQENIEQYIKNQEMNPLLSELSDKFNECKAMIEERINEAVLNEQQIYLKAIVQKLRDFLLTFFTKYKYLQVEVTIDRDILVVYFHIINNLFKRISSKFYISVQEMINLTKQVFEGNHSSDFSSIDRMDIINLAGIHKYNALTIFQRIHSRIQLQEAKLGPCELSFEQKDVLFFANQKQSLKKEKSQPFEERKMPKFKR